MNIDRKIATQALTDSFCLMYGEELRPIFTECGERLIESGIEYSTRYYNDFAKHHSFRNNIWIQIKHYNKDNKYYTSPEDLKEKIRCGLKEFLSDVEIAKLFKEKNTNDKNFRELDFPELKNAGNDSKIILEKLTDIKPKPVKLNKLDYFKDFPIFERSGRSNTKKYKEQDPVNLYGECGLGLDMFMPKNVKYYLEENESFYMNEAIPRKYYCLGSVIGREKSRIEFINKIKKHTTSKSDSNVKNILASMLRGYCFSSELQSSLLDIQASCGKEGFETSSQISESLKNISEERLKEFSELFKK